jgi:hypothetical protein
MKKPKIEELLGKRALFRGNQGWLYEARVQELAGKGKYAKVSESWMPTADALRDLLEILPDEAPAYSTLPRGHEDHA